MQMYRKNYWMSTKGVQIYESYRKIIKFWRGMLKTIKLKKLGK